MPSRRPLPVLALVVALVVALAGGLVAHAGVTKGVRPALRQAGPDPLRARPDPLLAAARTALGGDAKVLGLKGLRLTGTFWTSQNVLGGYTQDTETPMETRIAFPDRYLEISVEAFGPPGTETRRGFDGKRGIYAFFGNNSEPPGESAYVHKRAAQLLLILLARTEAWGGLTFEASGSSALQVRGPSGYAARVEFDPATHLLTKLVYRERRQVRTPNTAALRGSRPAGGQAGMTGGSGRSAAELPEIDITITVRDRRMVGGILLPHRLTTTAQGVDLWELRFETILVNPVFTRADFGG